MDKLGAALGAGAVAIFDGKSYTVPPLTLGVETEFSNWLIGRAKVALLMTCEGLPPNLRDAMVSAFMRDVAAGAYSFSWQTPYDAIQRDEAALAKLVYLCLREAYPELKEDQVIGWMRGNEANAREALEAIALANPRRFAVVPTIPAESRTNQ